jgi:hypothetical protein
LVRVSWRHLTSVSRWRDEATCHQAHPATNDLIAVIEDELAHR